MIKKEIEVAKNSTISKELYSQNLLPSQVKNLFKNKDVKLDGVRVNKDAEVNKGQTITFFIKEDSVKKTNFETIYQDNNILIINKPSGIEVEGGCGIVDKIKNVFAVHRLDKDTKGLLILAKNEKSKLLLEQVFKEKQITKKYVCEVLKDTNFNNQIFKAYLFKDSKKSIVKIYPTQVKGSQEILTRFKTIKHGNRTSVVECELLTGKTHQIRAHLAYLGHPILGDNKYGDKEENKLLHENKQKLFCYYLKFLNMPEGLEYLNNKEFKILPNWFNKIGD